MTDVATSAVLESATRPTRMLVIATLLCSYPGIDATGQAHMEYPPNTYVIPTPDPVMFPESFYLYCFERGVDAILIASCGTDSPYKGSFEQLAKQIDRTYALMRARDIDIRRLKLTAICSVCTKAFIKEVADMEQVLTDLGPIGPVGPGRGGGMTAKAAPASDYDVLVIGGGIAGLQTALDLGDRGRKVLIVEKEPSIGGKMIALSKVFPTMDCASCITTPRMSSAAHHDNVDIWVYSEVDQLLPADGGGFDATITRKATYVDEDVCIGCRLCEYACPVDVPHAFEGNMGARRAVYIPFGTAIPQNAIINADRVHLLWQVREGLPHHPTAIDFAQLPRTAQLHFDAAVLATGYQTTPIDAKAEYHGESSNVIGGLDMERLLAPNGPYGRVLRPSRRQEPDRDRLRAVRRLARSRRWACPTARASAACTPSSRPCCCRAPCRWRISPSTTWTSAPSAKATSSSTRPPKPWASSSSRPRWRASTRMADGDLIAAHRAHRGRRLGGSSRCTTWWCSRWACGRAPTRVRSWAWTWMRDGFIASADRQARYHPHPPAGLVRHRHGHRPQGHRR